MDEQGFNYEYEIPPESEEPPKKGSKAWSLLSLLPAMLGLAYILYSVMTMFVGVTVTKDVKVIGAEYISVVHTERLDGRRWVAGDDYAYRSTDHEGDIYMPKVFLHNNERVTERYTMYLLYAAKKDSNKGYVLYCPDYDTWKNIKENAEMTIRYNTRNNVLTEIVAITKEGTAWHEVVTYGVPDIADDKEDRDNREDNRDLSPVEPTFPAFRGEMHEMKGVLH